MRIGRNSFIIVGLLILLLLFSVSVSGAGVKTLHHLPFPGNITAADWNPALLGVSPYLVTAQLNPLALNIWTNAWTPNQLLLHINEYWDDYFKEELIDSIAGDSLSTGVDLASGVYLGSSSWAFQSGIQGSMRLGVDKDFVHVLLYGTGTDSWPEIELQDNFVKGDLILDTAFSKAIELPVVAEMLEWDSFYAGGGLHLLLGLLWLDMEAEGALETVFTDEESYFELDGKVDLFYSVMGMDNGGGMGSALDLGIWGEPLPNLGVGLSLTNLGFMYWDGVYGTHVEGNFHIEHPFSDIGEAFGDEDNDENDENDEQDEGEDLFGDMEPREPQLRRTPVSLQAGAYYLVHPRIELAGGFGFREKPELHMNVMVGSRFHFPYFLPLTLVAEYAGYKGTPSLSLSFGLRWGGFEPLTITLSDIKMMAGGGKEATIGLHTSLRF